MFVYLIKKKVESIHHCHQCGALSYQEYKLQLRGEGSESCS